MSVLFAIAGICVSGALWLRFVYRFDKAEPEPLKVVIRIGIVGGLLSGLPAGALNTFFAALLDIPMGGSELPIPSALIISLFVGFNEEILKALAAIFLIRGLREFNEPIDALVYSTAVALGFAVFENFDYVLGESLWVLLIRSFTAMPLHLGLAVIWGYGIARGKFLHGGRYGGVARYIVIAALIHAAYDFLLFAAPAGTGYLPLLTSLAVGIGMILFMKRRFLALAVQSPFVRAGRCVACGTLNSPTAGACAKCGQSLKQEFFSFCPKCLVKLPRDSRFCPKCGHGLTDTPDGSDRMQ